MRHLLLSLPLLLLAAACGSPCNAPSLTVSWRFDLADGRNDVDCATAGVDLVDVWIGNTEVAHGVSCALGAATFPDVGVGAKDLTLKARASATSAVIRYQQWGPVQVGSCGDTRVVMKPASGYLRIVYNTPDGLCYPSGGTEVPSYIWYNLSAVFGSTFVAQSSVNQVQTPTALPCQPATGTHSVSMEVPYGVYSLRWIQVVQNPTATSPDVPVSIFQHCRPASTSPQVTVRSGNNLATLLPVDLVATAGATCTP